MGECTIVIREVRTEQAEVIEHEHQPPPAPEPEPES